MIKKIEQKYKDYLPRSNPFKPNENKKVNARFKGFSNEPKKSIESRLFNRKDIRVNVRPSRKTSNNDKVNTRKNTGTTSVAKELSSREGIEDSTVNQTAVLLPDKRAGQNKNNEIKFKDSSLSSKRPYKAHALGEFNTLIPNKKYNNAKQGKYILSLHKLMKLNILNNKL